jgi:hypothetical protein
MTEELIRIVIKVKEKFTDKSDLLWTSYNTAKELRDELDIYIGKLTNGDKSCLDELNMHFLPTSTFQEHSLMNDWAEEYMKLSEEFDNIYAKMKNHS